MREGTPTDAMVDLETLGNSAGAVIVSIGAVKFDPHGSAVADPFYVNINIQTSLDAGLRIDGDTVRWWFEQEDAVRRRVFDPTPERLSVALERFATWVQSAERLWSHGSVFDVPILEAAYRAIGSRPPWNYRGVRDTRTLWSLVPLETLDAVPWEGVKHDALADATRQARMVQAAYATLAAPVNSGAPMTCPRCAYPVWS